MITAGIDVGTRFLKIAIVEDSRLLGASCLEMNRQFKKVFNAGLDMAVDDAERQSGHRIKKRHIKKMMATGYGAHLVKKANRIVKESVCSALGAHALNPNIKTVINAGGFFIRVVTLGDNGLPKEEAINEKCAAGSGKFLEMIAGAIDMPFNQISFHAGRSESPFTLTNSCAVFAESDVISQLNAGCLPEDIIAGVIQSIVNKTITLLNSANAVSPVCVTGGLAEVSFYTSLLSEMTGHEIVIPDIHPQLLPAYGAALAARIKQNGTGSS
ncbi:MAG: hypothetical protein KJ737_18950 [Proteobacteria bacterium]|nr:hypothetical protein [Pseudomonadota bacterium]